MGGSPKSGGPGMGWVASKIWAKGGNPPTSCRRGGYPLLRGRGVPNVGSGGGYPGWGVGGSKTGVLGGSEKGVGEGGRGGSPDPL